ncbi:MAG: response regulator [Deltaproteobacteria bacterium]|nr:response regulator [Deltaproteobacteria bacterium]
MTEAERLERRFLVVAPTGRDAALTCRLLAQAGLPAEPCADVTELCFEARRGAGALFVAEEVLRPTVVTELVALLEEQPSWSDLPILVFTGDGASLQGRARAYDLLGSRANVTLLDRPLRPITMLSAARAADRARRRQYQAREDLARQERAVRQRDQFLAMLGHELRNPLGTILLAVEVLTREQDAAAAPQLDIIRRHGRHLSRLVDDLLDVARVTSGKVTLVREEVDIRELVARCTWAIGPAVRALGLQVHLENGAERLVVDGDEVRLEQIVGNLLTNAVKYTPRGGSIHVALTHAGGDACVSVRDDGVGLDEETLAHAFDLFAQSERTLDRAQGGLGIGLTLVRSLVHLHGGTVEARSAGRGKGAEFVVRLPLRHSTDAHTPVFPVGPPPATAHRRILVIEDNSDTLGLMLSLLEAMGHEAYGASDGREGVLSAASIRPEVALVDIGLPKLDGYGVAREIRAEFGESIRLIAVTGYGQPDDRRRAQDAGFDGHLTKPIEILALQRLLSEPLRGVVSRRSAG